MGGLVFLRVVGDALCGQALVVALGPGQGFWGGFDGLARGLGQSDGLFDLGVAGLGRFLLWRGLDAGVADFLEVFEAAFGFAGLAVEADGPASQA